MYPFAKGGGGGVSLIKVTDDRLSPHQKDEKSVT